MHDITNVSPDRSQADQAELIHNLQQVREKILHACARSNRDPSDVRLIAVSKTKPVPMLQTVYGANQLDFGENKPQELKEKYHQLPKDIRWHMIGHLQRNKVKYVVGRSCLIHSLDSLRLAEAISLEAQKQGIIVPVLVEVNVAAEASKGGVLPADTLPLVQGAATLPGLHIQGLMTIAPFTKDPETNRPYFRELRNLSIDIAQKNIDNVNMYELSMGMTGDYEVAVEEGATLVRVGTGIFGSRSYCM